jgi:hypothetical protein
MSAEPETPASEEVLTALETCGRKTLRVITWFSVGMAVAALGVYVGTELRSRYKFKKRTPYDFYSKAGEQQASEFGMGI